MFCYSPRRSRRVDTVFHYFIIAKSAK